MYTIAKALASPNSGLEVKDRVWLKITIPKSFIGKHLVSAIMMTWRKQVSYVNPSSQAFHLEFPP